ncbi:uncharacterized protein N0V89_003962 [Didymosphaeria variabile]|uniref:Cytochrome P450 n=1 Tax=Didymosphaeria variabile TaxID=1932322 RepID=A0A9W8XPN6_9PLEO|nr:uncharacterized protein N0V89_003962 [Didymosphaeria variabile]KAJ4355937.1 hypothetical protein N0V89_003962 [Didymosphaeria variabile]
MGVESFQGLAHTVQTVAIAALIAVACYYFPKINLNAQLAKLPAFGAESGEKQRTEFLKHGKDMYLQGYEKFKNQVFRMTTSDGAETLVISPQFLPELRKLPDTVVSFPKAIEELMEVKYTGLLADEPLGIHAIRADLTPALARLNPVVYSEVLQALEEFMPKCEDWTAVNIYGKLVSMVATITGSLITAQLDIKKLRPLFKPWFAPRLPSVQRLHEAEKNLASFLEPVVRARQDAEKNDPDWQKPDDMLTWLMNRQGEFGVRSTHQLAKLLLGLVFASIHTTTLTATNILYTLAVSTEYIEPLREEIRQVMGENGDTISTRALQQMMKLDSFMKETVRFYPPGFTSFQRKVLRGFTLSNGQYIPAGAKIEVASHAVYQDPVNHPNSEPADVFDGYRSYKLRQGGTASDHARNQFVTTNEQNLMFGYGKHACPGRFFAANEIKMILANLILNYDFKNEDGSKVRYSQLNMGRQSSPDAKKNLLFKRVEV